MADLTKVDATPYGIRYTLGGADGAASKTQAQLLADLVPGPLKTLLRAIATDAAWTALDNDLRFAFSIVTAQFVGADNVTIAWSTGGGRNLAFAFAQTGNGYRVDLRFVHSFLA